MEESRYYRELWAHESSTSQSTTANINTSNAAWEQTYTPLPPIHQVSFQAIIVPKSAQFNFYFYFILFDCYSNLCRLINGGYQHIPTVGTTPSSFIRAMR